jgi:hypothetical protein
MTRNQVRPDFGKEIATAKSSDFLFKKNIALNKLASCIGSNEF